MALFTVSETFCVINLVHISLYIWWNELHFMFYICIKDFTNLRGLQTIVAKHLIDKLEWNINFATQLSTATNLSLF